jgi:bifunctional UDP-N-acetylglucosamine pyrophosphorylase/glucosamine-1-phosphate N-acetyltransferase
VSKKQTGGQAQDLRLAVVIMAAGKAARLMSRRPKALHEVGGKPLLQHVIAAASRLVEPAHIFVVVGHQAEKVQKAMAESGVQFVEQTEQRGTGHAIQCAMGSLAKYENVLVLSGDMPLIRPETIEKLWSFHQAQDAAMTILTAAPQNPTGYGRVVRRSTKPAEVEAIVEQKMLTPEQESIPEINAGLYAFKTATLRKHFGKPARNNPNGELYLTDLAGLMRNADERVVALQAGDGAEVLGANTIAELVALDATMRTATTNRLMAAGVTIFRPETCVIDAEVEVEPDTVIEPFVQLLGRTRVGADSHIRSYSVLENCTVGDRVIIRQSCVLVDSSIAHGADIGPFARIRPGCEIGEDVHIGNFVEVKRSKLHKGVKAGHLAYLGDAEIGAQTNIGAGVITCNYDGAHKHPTRIGEGVFVGSDSTLVAPVTVEDGSYIGAGSCITKDVPAGALAVARAHQVVKEGWAKARRARSKEREKS